MPPLVNNDISHIMILDSILYQKLVIVPTLVQNKQKKNHEYRI